MSHPVVNRIGTEEGDAAADKEMHPPLVRHARFGFMLLARIFAVLILIQVFLAGLATFWNAEQWASHAGFSRLLIVPPLLMLIASFIARLPRSFRLSSAGLIGMFILMAVTAKLSSAAGFVSALHPVLALMMFMGAVSNVRRIDALLKAK